eukprot:scaffold10761_cov62-Phaeocystis_antarctica.AAC.2
MKPKPGAMTSTLPEEERSGGVGARGQYCATKPSHMARNSAADPRPSSCSSATRSASLSVRPQSARKRSRQRRRAATRAFSQPTGSGPSGLTSSSSRSCSWWSFVVPADTPRVESASTSAIISIDCTCTSMEAVSGGCGALDATSLSELDCSAFAALAARSAASRSCCCCCRKAAPAVGAAGGLKPLPLSAAANNEAAAAALSLISASTCSAAAFFSSVRPGGRRNRRGGVRPAALKFALALRMLWMAARVV